MHEKAYQTKITIRNLKTVDVKSPILRSFFFFFKNVIGLD
jgi:hypothetical protein